MAIAGIALLLLPVAAILSLLTVWLFSFIDPAPQQDDCSFGPVSKAEYQRLLQQAKAQNWTVWPGLSKGIFWPSESILDGPTANFESELGERLQRSIEALQPQPASPDHTLAAAHAVLRSIGAEYVYVLRIANLRQEGKSPSASVNFGYFMPQIRFAPLCFLCLNWWPTTIAVVFHHDDASGSQTFEKIVLLHSDLKYTPKKERNTPDACPAFPKVRAR